MVNHEQAIREAMYESAVKSMQVADHLGWLRGFAAGVLTVVVIEVLYMLVLALLRWVGP